MDIDLIEKSTICTTREQSERLLALGLKKQTADMYYEMIAEGELPRIMPHTSEMDYFNLWNSVIPAWSLDRLIKMVYSCRTKQNTLGLAIIGYEDTYEDMILNIEQLIKKGYINPDWIEK